MHNSAETFQEPQEAIMKAFMTLNAFKVHCSGEH
jgi:hypothetical protein